MLPLTPTSPLFPYTTLFRSSEPVRERVIAARRRQHERQGCLNAMLRPARLRAMASLERSEEHTSELQSRFDLVCRLLLEKKKNNSYKLLYDKNHNMRNL